MFTFIKTELLKLKRSKQFLIILLGSVAPPLLMLLSLMMGNFTSITEELFYEQIIMYSVLLFNVITFSLLLGFLIINEYNNHTLKSVLAAPISKTKYIAGKFLTFELLVILLTLFSFILSLIVGYVTNIGDITLMGVGRFFTILLIGNLLLSLALTVFMFISLVFKNIVPVVIMSTMVAFVNIMIYGTDYSAIFPFSSSLIIAANELYLYSYGTFIPILVLILTAAAGLILSIVYFNKTNVKL